MTQINPNDPVVTILQQAVQGLRKEQTEHQMEMDEAMRLFAEGIGQMLGSLSSRVAVLEKQLMDLQGGSGGAAPADRYLGGSEL